MRVLVACVSQTGHLAPVLPLAEAFAARGDEVIVASAPEAAEVVARHRLEFRAVGPDFGDWFAELGRRMRCPSPVTAYLRSASLATGSRGSSARLVCRWWSTCSRWPGSSALTCWCSRRVPSPAPGGGADGAVRALAWTTWRSGESPTAAPVAGSTLRVQRPRNRSAMAWSGGGLRGTFWEGGVV